MIMYISSSCCADTGAWGVAWIHIFAYIYVGFEWRKGLVRNQADLHCSVTCCRLFCSKEKASPLAPLAGYEPDVPFCAVTSAVSFRSAYPKRAAKTPRPTFKNAMLCTHPFTGPVTCPEASVPQPTWKKNKALPPTPALTRTHADPDPALACTDGHWHDYTDVDPRGRTQTQIPRPPGTNTDPRGPTRGPFPAPTQTLTRTHTNPHGDPSPHWCGHPRGPTRTDADTDADPRGATSTPPSERLRGDASSDFAARVPGPAWVRVGARVSAGKGPRVGPRGSAWVRVGVRVSVRVSAGAGASRGSAWVHVSARVGAGAWGPAWVRVSPRGSASVSASVRGPGPRVGPRGSASVAAWVRVGPRGSASVPAWVRYRGPRASAYIRVSVRSVSAQCPRQCRAPCECVGPGPRVGLRGSASVPAWGQAVGARVGPRGSASVPAWVRYRGPRASAYIRVSVRSVSASVPGAVRVRGTRASRGSAWVRVSARVGAGRGGPRGSAWVRISVRVSAGRKNRGADLTHTFCYNILWQEHRTRIWHRHPPGTLHSNRATEKAIVLTLSRS